VPRTDRSRLRVFNPKGAEGTRGRERPEKKGGWGGGPDETAEEGRMSTWVVSRNRKRSSIESIKKKKNSGEGRS